MEDGRKKIKLQEKRSQVLVYMEAHLREMACKAVSFFMWRVLKKVL